MESINDIQKYAQRKQMQQEEANAVSAPQPVEAVNNAAPISAPAPSPVPASAVDSEAPAVTQVEQPQQKQEVPPVIPSLAVAPGGPTSPMNEKPLVTIANPTDTKLVGSNLPDITTETFEEAMKRGKYTPAQWLHENEKAAKEGRRPSLTMEDYLTVLKYGDLNETPDQKAKRERREQISQAISGLGNVIANAANLAFTAKGAVPIDLNSGMRYENERMQRIKEKRDALKEKSDALFLNAKQDEIRYARSLEAAKAKAEAGRKTAELKFQRDLAMKEIDNAYKIGAINLQQKNALERDAQKAKDNIALEGIKQKNRILLKRTPGAKSDSHKDKPDKYAASFTGKYGTYRFRDKDVASSVASRAVTMLKETATKNGDGNTVEMVKDAMSDLKSAPAVLEFLQQRLNKYPDVEKFIAESVDKYEGNVKLSNDEAIKAARDAFKNTYAKYNVTQRKETGNKRDYSQFKK